MVHNAISLFRQNQAKLFRQTKTDETLTILRQEKLGSDFLEGFSDARRGWGAQNQPSADRSKFGSHSRGEEQNSLNWTASIAEGREFQQGQHTEKLRVGSSIKSVF